VCDGENGVQHFSLSPMNTSECTEKTVSKESLVCLDEHAGLFIDVLLFNHDVVESQRVRYIELFVPKHSMDFEHPAEFPGHVHVPWDTPGAVDIVKITVDNRIAIRARDVLQERGSDMFPENVPKSI
jgi:hypothetical protein